MYFSVTRNYLHSSQSERQKHITVRGFVKGLGCFTLHVDATGRCLGVFGNAGVWMDKEFDILNKCERMQLVSPGY
jgi:hypothetical protein